MISSYQTIDHRVNSALLLAARMIEQARIDVSGTSRSDYAATCEATYHNHPSEYCAKTFLTDLVEFQQQNPDADHIEIALEVLRLCQL